jgi:2'-5' RNA ligase
VAIVPPSGVRAALGREIERLRSVVRGVAWVAPDNLHVTLKFLGHVEPARLERVGHALAGVASQHAAFDLEVRGLGAFPTPTRARVIWAGLVGGTPALGALAASVEKVLAESGFAPEGRPFAAHLTLARVREPRRDERLAAALAAGAARGFGRFRVEHLILMRSDLSPKGARYTPLVTLPLTAG